VHVSHARLDPVSKPERMRLTIEFLHVWWMVVDRENPNWRMLGDQSCLESRTAAWVQHTCVGPDPGHERERTHRAGGIAWSLPRQPGKHFEKQRGHPVLSHVSAL
jgi:hypothetical protein